jgi:putative tryptophan/tyrosine transport system substrate-binding protein
MKRREFITFLGAAAMARPITAHAQQPTMPTIGFISSTSPQGFAFYLAAFRNGLKQAGYFEGWNVAVEYRWAEGHIDRVPALAADLVNRKAAVIFADIRAALAAKTAAAPIPIVFNGAGDPIKLGLVRSLDRPGGNVTGISFPVSTIATKRLQMLRAMVPAAAEIGYLSDPNDPFAGNQSSEVETVAHAFGLRLEVVNATGTADFEPAFTAFARNSVDAIIVGAGLQFINFRDQIVALAARHTIPAIYNLRPWAIAGGLMSYGPSLEEAARQGGIYVARILKGASPADLPIVQSTKIEFVINLKTAKTLGLSVSRPLLLAADELIE